jgi:hypothetical protein
VKRRPSAPDTYNQQKTTVHNISLALEPERIVHLVTPDAQAGNGTTYLALPSTPFPEGRREGIGPTEARGGYHVLSHERRKVASLDVMEETNSNEPDRLRPLSLATKRLKY